VQANDSAARVQARSIFVLVNLDDELFEQVCDSGSTDSNTRDSR
jgi:hypothetical protein